jgi:hypothetical protein
LPPSKAQDRNQTLAAIHFSWDGIVDMLLQICNAFDAEDYSAVEHYKGIITEYDLISIKHIMTRNFLQHKANPLHPASG